MPISSTDQSCQGLTGRRSRRYRASANHCRYCSGVRPLKEFNRAPHQNGCRVPSVLQDKAQYCVFTPTNRGRLIGDEAPTHPFVWRFPDSQGGGGNLPALCGTYPPLSTRRLQKAPAARRRLRTRTLTYAMHPPHRRLRQGSHCQDASSYGYLTTGLTPCPR